MTREVVITDTHAYGTGKTESERANVRESRERAKETERDKTERKGERREEKRENPRKNGATKIWNTSILKK